ncbi:M1-specific T cell receptor beta chain-like isoform X6 [Centroberyx gerrardi]
MITQILITVTVSSLWLQGHCQDVTQHPEISWSFVSKSAEMNCSHKKAVDYSQMYWYRQCPGEAMSLIVFTAVDRQPDYEGGTQHKYSAIKTVPESGALTVKDLQLEDSAVYFCAVHCAGGREAYFGGGTRLTVLDPNIPITPPTVKILQPSLKECKDKKDKKNKKTLVCVASGFYPDHVSVFWQIEGENVTDGVATDNATLRDGKLYSITGRLRVPARTWHTPGRKFNCTVSFFNGTHTTYHSGLVYGTDLGQGEGMTREKYLQITQTAKLSYGVFIAKSSLYGVFVLVLVWKLQASSGKQSN